MTLVFNLRPFVNPHVPGEEQVQPAEPYQLALVSKHGLESGPVRRKTRDENWHESALHLVHLTRRFAPSWNDFCAFKRPGDESIVIEHGLGYVEVDFRHHRSHDPDVFSGLGNGDEGEETRFGGPVGQSLE